ncbi:MULTISPECIES: hypothetical protein [Gammaproteobacteria]|uniref:hypothetical protein n=1 Tax=Gammaproteobacteria TaxID=1236 RepID=UPI00244BD0F8|nr:hypothetical protein [Cobetia sp. 1AS1]MDH2296021.1 hypothetical protein [Cobetia sp. 1AS1]
MGKGSSPKKPEATAEEKELAKQGVEKWNRYATMYAPLEDDMLANVDRSTTNLRQGRGNADLMREASNDFQQSFGNANVATSLSNLNAINSALKAAGASNASQAVLGDRQQRDGNTLAAINTGLGIAGQQQQSLTQLGQQNNAAMLDTYRRESEADIAKSNAQFGALNSLATMGMGKYQEYTNNKALRQSLFETTNPNGFTDQLAIPGGYNRQ